LPRVSARLVGSPHDADRPKNYWEANSPTIASQTRVRLVNDDPNERIAVLAELGQTGGYDSFKLITRAFDDPVREVRNAAARALFELRADRSGSFIRAFREAEPERSFRIAKAIAESGLAADEISQLASDNFLKAYDAFSVLFLMATAGEFGPIVSGIENGSSIEIGQTLAQILGLCGRPEALPACSHLVLQHTLPSEVRSAIMEAIYQISSHARETAPPSA
jgi:HEAT repeat protein